MEGYLTAGPDGYAARAAVHSGTCGSLTQLAASLDLSVPLVVSGLTIGQQYYLEMEAVQAIAFRVAVRDGLVNDACDGAVELPFSTVQDYTNTPRIYNALASDGTGGCMPKLDLWYHFTAAHTSAHFVAFEATISLTAMADAGIELYTGTCGSLTSVSCVLDVGRAVFTGLVPGQSYFIRWSTRVPTSFVPMLFDQPVNDEVAGALPAPWGSTFAQAAVQYDNFGATQSMPTHCFGAEPDDDMWFTFTASATAHTIHARQRNNTFQEPSVGQYQVFQVQVYDTLTSDAAVLGANLVSCAFSPVSLTGLTVGKTYLYRVLQHGSTATGRCGFSTSVTNANNDDAAGAQLLAYAEDYTAYFNTDGATQSLPGADCQVDDTADDDIWFKFVAAPGVARIVVGYAMADVTIELFSGTPGNLTPVACDGNILELPELATGQTYHVRVYSWGNAVPVEGRIGLFPTPSLTANGCVAEDCLGPVLVPNPGIEQGEVCSSLVVNVNAVDGYGRLLAPGWTCMQSGSSDAHGSCAPFDVRGENPGTFQFIVGASSMLSRSGTGMAGLLMADADGDPYKYVEYLDAQLTEPLVPGEAYLISFYAAADPTALSLNGLGAALSEGPLVGGETYRPLKVEPAIVSQEAIYAFKWTNVCGIYVPTTPVDHITIGAFPQEGNVVQMGPVTASKYVIDDVVVARVTDPSCITSIGDVPPVDEDANGSGDALRLYPNPANDRVNIVGGAGLFGERAVVEVFDVRGTRVHAEEVAWFQSLQPLDLPAEWKEGLYLVMVRVEGQAPKAARLVVRR